MLRTNLSMAVSAGFLEDLRGGVTKTSSGSCFAAGARLATLGTTGALGATTAATASFFVEWAGFVRAGCWASSVAAAGRFFASTCRLPRKPETYTDVGSYNLLTNKLSFEAGLAGAPFNSH